MRHQSPFKFLDAYAKEDREIFFGRDEEIESLYEMVHQTNLTLVYGRSGTGKTSLIHCGLANRFEASDWFDMYVRRNDNINVSLSAQLNALVKARKTTSKSALSERLKKRRAGQKATGASSKDIGTTHPVIETLRNLYTQYFKPIYLIFDQFEELFILGSREEQQEFYQTIATILKTEGYCRMIFVLREEAIAQLYDFEKVVPSLFEKRLRVEPLSRANTRDVVVNTTDKFEIKLETPEVADSIIEAISEGKGRVQLPYLQVFLDALYQEAALANGEKIIFSQANVNKLGSIDDVLASFLDDQSAAIQSELLAKHPELNLNAVKNLLNVFVSLEGTKQPMTQEQIKTPQLSQKQIAFCLERFEKARILRFSNDRYELAHDALAARIASQRSTADIAYLEVVKLVKDRFRAYKNTQTLLNNNELVLYDTYAKRIKDENALESDELSYVSKSISFNKQKRRRRMIIVTSIIVALSLLSAFAFQQKMVAEQNFRDLAQSNLERDRATYERFVSDGRTAMEANDYMAAISEFETALSFNDTGSVAQNLLAEANNKVGLQRQFTNLLEEGAVLQQQGSLNAAKAKFEEALALDYDENRAQAAINTVDGLITQFANHVQQADAFFDAGNAFGYQQALPIYRKARAIKPNDAHVNQRIAICEQGAQVPQDTLGGDD